MVLKSILFFLMLCTAQGIFAQSRADMRLGELVNDGDIFALEREYPVLKDSVTVRVLDLIARAQIGVGFNRLEEAECAMDSLLRYHREELGPESSIGIAALRAMNLLNLGLYGDAGEAGGELVRELEDVLPFESIYSFIFMEKVGKAMADVPAPYMVRPKEDVYVPMRSADVGRGKHIYIPVEVNGVTKDFIFDTGCSVGNFVSEDYAREAGLKVVADSIPVAGMTIGYVKLAVADSMKVGDMVYMHPLFMVAPEDPQLDSVFAFDGVMGHGFIRAAGEIVIDSREGYFMFPYERSREAVNMVLSSNVPVLCVGCRGKEMELVFDSGNVKTDLGREFAGMFPDLVEGLETHSAKRGGFGGIAEGEVVTLDSLALDVAGAEVLLDDVDVMMESPDLGLFGGSLGADFVLGAGRMTISYDGMFVRVEGD